MNKDGYEWLKRFDRQVLMKYPKLRGYLLFYYKPFWWEKYRKGIMYRWMGVPLFGKLLPTGGFLIRKWTKSKMRSYVLKNSTLNAALEFRYKSCLFETLHLPFLIVLLWRSLWWYFDQGNLHLALELMIVNAVFNIWPVMHQRYTRLRIDMIGVANAYH